MYTISLFRLPPSFLLPRSTVRSLFRRISKLDKVPSTRFWINCGPWPQKRFNGASSHRPPPSATMFSAFKPWTRAVGMTKIQNRTKTVAWHNGNSQLRPFSRQSGLPEKPSQQNISMDRPLGRLLDLLKAKGQLSDLAVPPIMTNFQRLFTPFLFTCGVCAMAYAYSEHWTPPRGKDRLFPDIPQAIVTVSAITAINTTILLLWKVPIPLNWRILNRYFISVPGFPNALSMLGSVFSHQSFVHLALNSVALYAVGSTLCDEIGRGNFLCLYISSGVISSFASLAYHVLRRRFDVFSSGASGAVAGVVGTYVYLNPNSQWFFIFFPFVTFKAAHLMGLIAGLEIWGLSRGYSKIDHMAHLAGMASGFGYGMWLWRREIRKREERRKRRGGSTSGGKGIMGWFGW